jgi:hypothetical protein
MTDHRLLILEPEYARILTTANRDGSILGLVLRQGWDGDPLAASTRKLNRPPVNDYHLGLLAHVTVGELNEVLRTTDLLGGSANRCLYIAARRARVDPFASGPDPDTVTALGDELRARLDEARRHQHVTWTAEGREYWRSVYEALAEDDPPGLLGAAVARSEAQVLRLCVTYCLLDGLRAMTAEHLYAALAVWHYSRDTATQLFGRRSISADGNRVLDALEAIDEAPPPSVPGAPKRRPAPACKEMTRSEVLDVFSRHRSPADLDDIRDELLAGHHITVERRPTPGRPVEVWQLVPGAAVPVDLDLYSDALWGIAGSVVKELGPATEADPAALLVHFLVAAGVAIGHGPHYSADGAWHGASLFAVIVGRTAKARKGTAWRNVRPIILRADPALPIRNGFGSGENLIDVLSDGTTPPP